MALIMLPTVFGAAVYQVNIVMGTLLASYLPEGSVSYLYYADRLVQFPLGVFGIAVSTAALPSLSGLAAQGKYEAFSETLRSSLGLTLFIALPAMAGLLALAEPIISLLFGRGAFTPEAVTYTATALVAYSAGLPFIAAARPLVAAFYAHEDTRTPVIIAVACLFINIGLGLALMGPLGHVGLALAVTVSSAANAVLLGVALLRKGRVSVLVPPAMLRLVVLAAVVFYGAWLTRESTWLWLVMIPVWVAAYFGLAHVLKVEEAASLWGVVKRRVRRGR